MMKYLAFAFALSLAACSSIKTTEDLAEYLQVPVSHLNAPFSFSQIEEYRDSIGLSKNLVYFIDTTCLPNAAFVLPTVKVFDKEGRLFNWRGCNADYPGYLEEGWARKDRYQWLEEHTLKQELQCIDTSVKSFELDEGADFYVVYYWSRTKHRFNLQNLKTIIDEIEADEEREIQLFAVNLDNRADWGWSKEEYKRKRIERRTVEIPPRDKWFE